jgi:hypothetical protein
MAMTLEQQKALARERARLKLAESKEQPKESTFSDVAKSVGANLVRGATDIAGMPGNLTGLPGRNRRHPSGSRALGRTRPAKR